MREGWPVDAASAPRIPLCVYGMSQLQRDVHPHSVLSGNWKSVECHLTSCYLHVCLRACDVTSKCCEVVRHRGCASVHVLVSPPLVTTVTNVLLVLPLFFSCCGCSV